MQCRGVRAQPMVSCVGKRTLGVVCGCVIRLRPRRTLLLFYGIGVFPDQIQFLPLQPQLLNRLLHLLL